MDMVISSFFWGTFPFSPMFLISWGSPPTNSVDYDFPLAKLGASGEKTQDALGGKGCLANW